MSAGPALPKVRRLRARPPSGTVERGTGGVRVSQDDRSPADEVRELARTVRGLEERLRAVEELLARTAEGAGPLTAMSAAQAPRAGPGLAAFAPSRTAPLVGRLLLVMGGAFVLRALTESGQIPQAVGVVLGLGYAVLWLGVAVRAGARQDALTSAVYGAASALISYPLIWETSAQFGILSPWATAGALGGVGLLGLGLAWRHRLLGVAWATSTGATLCGLALLLPRSPATGHVTATLVLCGIGALWVGRARAWEGPRWIGALAADAAAAMLITDVLEADDLSVAPVTAITLLLLLFAGYVGSIAAYLFARWWRMDGFDTLQTLAALGIGFGGALGVASATDTAPQVLGLASLVLAVLLYVLAFRVLDRERRRTFYYGTSVALVLVLVGSVSVLARPALPWAILAIATVLTARRFGRATLGLHGALYAVAAAAASGLLGHGWSAWLASAASAWPPPPYESYLALAAAVVCAIVPTRSEAGLWTRFVVVPQAVLLAVVAWGAGGAAIDLLARFLPAGSGGGLHPAWLASLRTAVLAALALASAWIARVPRFEPARWFVVPLLVAGGLKLALEDFAHGQPATLAVSFVLYGAVLIVASRLVRTLRGAGAPPEAKPRPGPGAS